MWCSLCRPSSAELCTAMVSCKPSACSPLMKLCFTPASFSLNLNASLYFDQVHLDLCNGLAYTHALTLRQMRPQRSSSGSAFVTDTTKRHIMTNSHVVSCTNTKRDATDERGVLAAVQQSSLPMPFQQRHHGRPCLSQSGPLHHFQRTQSTVASKVSSNDDTRAFAQG